MGSRGRFFLHGAVLIGFSCGGSTSPPDSADGALDAAGTVDASIDSTGGAIDAALDSSEDPAVGDGLAAWQKLELVNAYGPCPTDSCSSSWVVSPDGHIAKTRLGDAGAAQMAPADLALLDSIVSSKPFLDGMSNGFVCDRPPTDVFVSLRLEREGVLQTQSVTGCVLSGPSGNLPRRVNELVTRY
jgi:hypothetical protein